MFPFTSRSRTGRTSRADHPGPGDRVRAAVLGEVAAEGVPGLARALRRAAAGDEAVAAIAASALTRAVPGVGAFTAHDLLVRAHVGEREPAGALRAEQRTALVEAVRLAARSSAVARARGRSSV